MEWSEIPPLWRKTFEIAWESFLEGARPIGALVTNNKGEVIATGKSSTMKKTIDSIIFYNELAHAEVNALLKLDNRIHKKVNDYNLYSTLEPCPLCFSAFYMSGIRNLKFAAKDKYGGSTNLKDKTPYLSRKPISIEGPIPFLEDFSIILGYYYDLSINYEKAHPVHKAMEEDYPDAVNLAERWVMEGRLNNPEQYTVELVFKMMIKELQTKRHPQCITSSRG